VILKEVNIMTERDLPINKSATFFFFCPEKRDEEAIEVLSEISGLSIVLPPEPQTQLLIGSLGSREPQRGFRFEGITPISQFPKIVAALSNKGIAGYSRETQVYAYKVDEIGDE
jgi:hypothetical protein